MDAAQLEELFSGPPGTPVPQVDPADIKALWQIVSQMSGQSFIGMGVLKGICKPGANTKAVMYRAGKIEMLRRILPDVMEPLIREKLDAVLKAAAEIPMEWVGMTVHHRWTFNPDDFVRRVREAA